MSIRIRAVDGVIVALCAARSMPKPGDIYLDDACHHALTSKFGEDFRSEGYNVPAFYSAIREREESNNRNRDEWDRTFGKGAAMATSHRTDITTIETEFNRTEVIQILDASLSANSKLPGSPALNLEVLGDRFILTQRQNITKDLR